jgi:hypothetical protein
MRRWVPFSIALFMLTPFALWAGLGLLGPGGAAIRLESNVGTVLLAASLPLAGLFWVQNLRQLGDAMGAPSRLRIAARLAALLPAAILGIGTVGTAWLLAGSGGYLEPFISAIGTLVMAGFALIIARAPVSPGRVETMDVSSPADDDRIARTILLFIANVAMSLTLLAYYWTPWVLLWALCALIPMAFFLMMSLAWWAAQSGVVDHPAAVPARDPANDGGDRRARAA